jgi:predicted Ser/Thr protein kinase
MIRGGAKTAIGRGKGPVCFPVMCDADDRKTGPRSTRTYDKMRSMVCRVCGSERASDGAACATCGASPEAPTVGATVSSERVPSTPHAPPRSTHAGSGIDHGAFTPGTVLGTRYRIVGLLGRGGMGEVYRADDLTLGQPVALKFLRGDDPGLATRLREETRTARQVSHPNVCRVHDVAEWAGRPFVSMEYIDGEDLASLLRRIGRLQPDKAVEIVRQVCAGLAAAHDRGVLHRDLKPANVMLDARGKVRITDFGLASFVDDDRSGEIAGTPAYMAPEQIAGGRSSPQTDLYAAGLLLFELLAGTPAYGSVSLAERRQQAAASKPSLSMGVRATIDPRILTVIDRCLEPEAARRPESALRLAAALPGGDPLEAALAAGETPAPHVVADAADDNPLQPAAAVSLLVGFAAMILGLLAFSGGSVYSRFVPFRQSPEVLAARAEEVRLHLGYNDVPEDRARGFVGRDEYLRWLRARTRNVADWTPLRSIRPQAIVFWYRCSPHPLIKPSLSRFGSAPFRLAASSTQPILPIESMPLAPGETYLELDPDGALSTLGVMSSVDGSPPAGNVPVDWISLFAEARLDPARFSSVAPPPIVPVFADARAAWTGPSPDGSGVPLRIEAAAVAGRPVYFRIIAPWTGPTRPAGVPASIVFVGLIYFALLSVGAVLAKRNVQTGKSDSRGAARVAATVGLGLLAAQLLEAPHTWIGSEIYVVTGALSWALFIATATWVSYVALEPYVRRHWPQSLIAWTRLLAGRWSDRRVGRDLLIGAVAGLATVVIDRGSLWLAGWRSGDAALWGVDLGALSSAGSLAAAFLRSIAQSTAFPIDWLFLLLLIKLLSQRLWLVVLIGSAIPIALRAGAITDPLVQLPLAILSMAVRVVLLTQYGLLAGATAMFVDMMSSSVIVSLDLSSFFGRTMIAGVLLLAAPAILGFYATIAGRSLLGRRFDLSET